MKNSRFRSALLATAFLTACFGAGGDEKPAMVSMAARNGVRWTYEILQNGVVSPTPPLRPSAMLGPYVAAFLSLPLVETSHSAVSGVLAGTAILFEEEGFRDESYALLEELGLALSVDLTDHLNRALDRQMALDAYRDGLVDVATRSHEHVGLLEIRKDDSEAEVREIRREASLIQRGLNDALRAKDYATAGARQAELSRIQGELAVASAGDKELGNIIGLFDDSLEAAAERVAAIDANRDALIAGVSVVDIPGAEDLGVIEQPERGRRRADPDDVFGPTGGTE